MKLVTIRTDKHYSWMVDCHLHNANERLRAWVNNRNMFRYIDGLKYYRNPLDQYPEIEAFVQDLYFEYRSTRKIIMDYTEFRLFVYGYKQVNNYRYVGRSFDYSKAPSYIKKPHHKPKEWTEEELNRQAWREHKGIVRDKAKGTGFGRGKKFWRNCEDRWFRQANRQNIKNENWDAMGDEWIQNKWLWD